jgi:hypothetical protein
MIIKMKIKVKVFGPNTGVTWPILGPTASSRPAFHGSGWWGWRSLDENQTKHWNNHIHNVKRKWQKNLPKTPAKHPKLKYTTRPIPYILTPETFDPINPARLKKKIQEAYKRTICEWNADKLMLLWCPTQPGVPQVIRNSSVAAKLVNSNEKHVRDC